ncbi:MAG: U32 family peptidase [Spirochaetaceae bacterium]|nr:U32 family peptidase [Spirochaetaceae bacterium]
MELLSPAGSADKLRYAYRYGADAAYIGLPLFSLRAQAENIEDEDLLAPERLSKIKNEFSGAANIPGARRKLYCAINIFFHNDDLSALDRDLPRIAEYPFDGFIVSDLGAYQLLRDRFPDREYHLSTQANNTNWRSAKVYHDMGFSRIVPGRELSLDEIRSIKDHIPDLEIEAFIHGAMCMAYSGRCFLSSWLAGRSANKGDCTQPCRWHYKVLLEEEKRPGQLLPVESGETGHGGYTLVMSSRDLCMIDHIEALREAGVDSLKIEGRMKSLYYVALATRAYRYAIDHPGEENPFREDLSAISHREYDTGFYFGREGMDLSTTKAYRQSHLFAGSVEEPPDTLADSAGLPVKFDELAARFDEAGWSKPVYVDMKNTINLFDPSMPLELLGPESNAMRLEPGEARFFDTDGAMPDQIRHGKPWFMQVKESASGDAGKGVPRPYWLLRVGKSE